MKTLRIVCRSSRLSLVQANIAKNIIVQSYPELIVEIIPIETSGDANTTSALYEMEGRDFFSKEVDQYLISGKADISVHSMKDLSAERIEDERFYGAVLERNDPRDIAIFNPNVREKISNQHEIVIGTSSLRRQLQAINFLKGALPKANNNSPSISSKPIRGNVDSRLQQLKDGKFDGIILAAAGLNRLLDSKENHDLIQGLLAGKKLMFLPLIECSPAPAQGALLAEALLSNKQAVDILRKVNQEKLSQQLSAERKSVSKYGGGCHQQYGAIHIDYKYGGMINIAGIDTEGNDLTDMLFDTKVDLKNKILFSAVDFMKDFFTYGKGEEINSIDEEVVFVSHHRAVTDALIPVLKNKRVWAAGTRTWHELAAKGIWCEGCSDGFGFLFLEKVFASPLLSIPSQNILTLTNTQSATHWKQQGINAVGAYRLVPSITDNVKEQLSKADVIFWTNYQQYEACVSYLKPIVLHLCPSGNTARQLKKQGIDPVIFPTIKAFNVWRRKNSI